VVVAPLQVPTGKVKQLSVAIPASVISDTPHLREKTAKLGAIARASSIFGVSNILLYDDAERGHDNLEFCFEVLTYLETPQYLRKKLFRLSPTLRFTGILPPLQTPPHNVSRTLSDLKVGDIREGLVVSKRDESLIVDAGLPETVTTRGAGAVGERVVVRLLSVGRTLRGEVERAVPIRDSAGEARYWGYKVRKTRSISALLQQEDADVKIGTSRYGSPVSDVWPSVKARLEKAGSILVVFGSPKEGLKEILQHENLRAADAFDYFINMVPNQHTATVRTEEALLISLGLLNFALAS